MITDEQVQKALDYLLQYAEEAAQATAHVKHLDQFRKAKLAMLASEVDGSEARRDREAHAHPEYIKFLEGYKEAVRRDELHRHQRKQAELVIDAWRTQEASNRAAGKLQ